MRLLHVGSGNHDRVMLCNQSVADTGQHICDGIVYEHCVTSFRLLRFTSSPCARRGFHPCTQARGSKCGRCRTCGAQSGGGRRYGSGCKHAWRTSAPSAGLMINRFLSHVQALLLHQACAKGIPSSLSSSLASSSVLAVVTKIISMPRILSTLSYSISGKMQLFADAQGVVAAAVEGLGGNAAEVAHAGQGDVHELIGKLIHSLAAQRHLRADVHALAELEVCDGLAWPW